MFKYSAGCGTLVINNDTITIEKRPFVKKYITSIPITNISKVEYMYPNKTIKEYGFIKIFTELDMVPDTYPHLDNSILYNDLSLIIIYYQLFDKASFENAISEIQKSVKCPVANVGNDIVLNTKGEVKKPITKEQNNFPKKYLDEFNIPKEVIDLLWIADGNFKNYSENKFMPDKKVDIGAFSVSFNTSNAIEPSLISLQMPIAKPVDMNSVEKLGYYPSYRTMTPEQRYIYLQWLQNPCGDIDIGYVFVFYYGLERHLIEGEFEKAFDMILKLRKVHSNSSFQSYSFNALLLSSMLAQKYDCFVKLDNTLDKTSINFDISIYLAVKKWFGLHISCEEIISLASNVKFQNRRYIKNNYTDFLMILQDILIERYGTSYINLSEFDNYTYETSCTCYIANTSFDYHIRECHYPDLLTCKEFKETIYDLLQCTHEKVKAYLAEQRKK